LERALNKKINKLFILLNSIMESWINTSLRESYRSKLDDCINYYKEEILKTFSDKVDFIALTWSFSTWEESYLENGDSDSDVDFFVGLKDDVDMKQAIIEWNKLASVLNQKRKSNEPKFSIRLDTKQNFLNEKSDTITPYQINETKKFLYGTLTEIPNKSIEFNSQVGLLGVAYAQLLSWMYEKDYKNLAKGVFNQIWTLLIKEQKYSTSYAERIKRFMDIYPEFNISKQDFEHLLELKLCPSEDVFVKNFGSIEHFLQVFAPLFEYETIKSSFDVEWDLDQFCEKMTTWKELHTCIRMAFICYYLKQFDLAEKYIGKVESSLWIEKKVPISLSRINSTWNYRLQYELWVI